MSRSRPQRPLRVAIIGAGLGGLAAAVKLRQRTAAEFVIFEQAAGIGGTWRDNRYPGCEVDIHSHAYSYSFLKYEWPRTHATQPELLAYAEHVVRVFGLAPHLRLNTEVTSLTWEEAAARYTLTTQDGERHEFDVVITATGLLSVPRYPDWPGLASFGGVCFHTARWEPGHDLSGKTVAVVGTGSTSAQVVPSISAGVGRLYVYQREPGWIEPKREREFTRRELWLYRHVPLAQRAHRSWLFYRAMRRFKGFDVNSKLQRQLREACLAFIDRSIDDPATREAVTPRYPWGCKRVVLASTFYEAFNRPNVELVPHEVTRVTPAGLVDATGAERQVDVLILSTGFQPTSFLEGHRGQGTRRARHPRRVAGTAQRVPRHHRGRLPELLHPLRAEHQRRRVHHSPAGAAGRGRRERRPPPGAGHGIPESSALRRHQAGSAAPVGGLGRPPARHGRVGDGLRLQQLLPRRGGRERHPVAGHPPRLRGGDPPACPVRPEGTPLSHA